MATVAILGGGVSGLSCAYYLKTLGKSKVKYLFLLEKGPKFGGWIQTTRFPDGAVFEHGPRSLRISGKPGYNALSLAEELGLTSRVVPVNRERSSALKRFILVKNQLHQLPSSLQYLFRTIPPFQKPLFYCVRKDLTTPKSTLSDESVYDFAQRRFSNEIAEYVFDPLCRGICADDARETSVRTLLPELYEMDQKYGSVIKGMFRRKRSGISGFLDSNLAFSAHRQSWRMWSLRSGLSELIDALACTVEEKGVADLHVNAECTNLKFINGKAIVTVDGDDIEVDHVFSSIPSIQVSPLLSTYTDLMQCLSSISFISVAVVYLEFNGFVLKCEGFGFLTPSTEDSKVLGIVFDSCCFPEQNGLSRTRITCMMGGKWFNKIFGNVDTVTEEQVLRIAMEETKKHLTMDVKPVRYQVAIQKHCLPQYTVGHYKKIEMMETEIKNKGLCLSLLGASYQAVGVPYCIYNARLSVENYLKDLS